MAALAAAPLLGREHSRAGVSPGCPTLSALQQVPPRHRQPVSACELIDTCVHIYAHTRTPGHTHRHTCRAKLTDNMHMHEYIGRIDAQLHRDTHTDSGTYTREHTDTNTQMQRHTQTHRISRTHTDRHTQTRTDLQTDT